jgi:hypothetical protein
MNDEILTEITEQCEKSPFSRSCPEEDCVLYRIEQIKVSNESKLVANDSN